MTKKATRGGAAKPPRQPNPAVQAVKPQVRMLRASSLAAGARTMYQCSVKDCGFHTAVNRACPRHPSARLNKVSG